MKLLMLIGSCIGLTVATHAAENDDSLAWLARVISEAKTAGSCPLSINTRVITKQDSSFLSFELVNISGQSLTIRKNALPWANPDSIQVAALTTDGVQVPAYFPILDDFRVETVTIAPNEKLSGDYDLSWRWSDEVTPPKGLRDDKPVILIWAYRVSAIEIPRDRIPVCTGITTLEPRPH